MQTRYNGGSVAYDLERFQPKPRARVKKPALVVANPGVKARARRRVSAVLGILAAVAVVAGVVVTMLYGRALLTELSQQIASETAKLEKEQSEFTRLTAELDAKISLRNVEDYATQTLGMLPVDKSQVAYVDLSEGDKIELTSESPKQTLLDKIQLAVANVRERLGED